MLWFEHEYVIGLYYLRSDTLYFLNDWVKRHAIHPEPSRKFLHEPSNKKYVERFLMPTQNSSE